MLVIDESIDKNYRLVECYSTYNFYLRYEIQEKYSYYNDGESIESWKLVCWSNDRLKAKEMFMRYKNYKKDDKHKKCKLSFSDVQDLWS